MAGADDPEEPDGPDSVGGASELLHPITLTSDSRITKVSNDGFMSVFVMCFTSSPHQSKDVFRSQWAHRCPMSTYSNIRNAATSRLFRWYALRIHLDSSPVSSSIAMALCGAHCGRKKSAPVQHGKVRQALAHGLASSSLQRRTFPLSHAATPGTRVPWARTVQCQPATGL